MDPYFSLLSEFFWLLPVAAAVVGLIWHSQPDSPIEPLDLEKTIRRIDAQGSRRRILVADDSMTIQKVVELTFMDQDIHITTLSDGQSAIEILNHRRFDLLIADVHMPGAGGYDVCSHSKKLYPDMPVLLLVGAFDDFDERLARQAGADRWIKKPFDSQELLGEVAALWRDGYVD